MIGFLWRSAKGYRLRPWRSPYLRWRIETYWGLHADRISPAEFRVFMRRHWRELLRFLHWAKRMDSAAQAASVTTYEGRRPIPDLLEPARSSNRADSA